MLVGLKMLHIVNQHVRLGAKVTQQNQVELLLLRILLKDLLLLILIVSLFMEHFLFLTQQKVAAQELCFAQVHLVHLLVLMMMMFLRLDTP